MVGLRMYIYNTICKLILSLLLTYALTWGSSAVLNFFSNRRLVILCLPVDVLHSLRVNLLLQLLLLFNYVHAQLPVTLLWVFRALNLQSRLFNPQLINVQRSTFNPHPPCFPSTIDFILQAILVNFHLTMRVLFAFILYVSLLSSTYIYSRLPIFFFQTCDWLLTLTIFWEASGSYRILSINVSLILLSPDHHHHAQLFVQVTSYSHLVVCSCLFPTKYLQLVRHLKYCIGLL